MERLARVAPTSIAPAPSIIAPREQLIDTDVELPPRPEVVNTNRKVRTPQDEDLPEWVPITGRLTVVESSDLAENLGLVPMGTSKSGDASVSVAELLEAERLARLDAGRDGHWRYRVAVDPAWAVPPPADP